MSRFDIDRAALRRSRLVVRRAGSPRQRERKSIKGTSDNIASSVIQDVAGGPQEAVAVGPYLAQLSCKILVELNSDPGRSSYRVEQKLSDSHRYSLGVLR
jgi:hypothetical protein